MSNEKRQTSRAGGCGAEWYSNSEKELRMNGFRMILQGYVNITAFNETQDFLESAGVPLFRFQVALRFATDGLSGISTMVLSG